MATARSTRLRTVGFWVQDLVAKMTGLKGFGDVFYQGSKPVSHGAA